MDDFNGFINEAYNCNDPANEPRPESVIYTQIFQELRDYNKKAADLLGHPLKRSKFQNTITNGLLSQVYKRTKHEFPDEVRFAIVGDMKAGRDSALYAMTV